MNEATPSSDVYALDCSIRVATGDRTVSIVQLQRAAPATASEAEMWIGGRWSGRKHFVFTKELHYR
jgi:hypothetical protein